MLLFFILVVAGSLVFLELFTFVYTTYLCDAPYLPLDKKNIDLALEVLQLSGNDVFVDFGSGDGRVLLSALREHGVKRAIGVEKDRYQALKSKIFLKLRYKGYGTYCVYREDIFRPSTKLLEDLSQITAVYMYLFPSMIDRIYIQLLEQKRPFRIVCCRYSLSGIPPTSVIKGEEFDSYYYEIG